MTGIHVDGDHPTNKLMDLMHDDVADVDENELKAKATNMMNNLQYSLAVRGTTQYGSTVFTVCKYEVHRT